MHNRQLVQLSLCIMLYAQKKEKGHFELALEFLIQKEINEKFDRARYEISLSADNKEGIIVRNENLYLIKEGINNNYLIKEGINNKKTRPKGHFQRTLFPVEPPPPDRIVTERGWTPPGWRKIISKSPKGNDYFRSETTDWNITYRFGPKKAALASIPEDELRFPITLWIKKILTEGIQFLQLNSVAMRKPCRADAPVNLQMDGSNLPKVIKYLQDGHKKYFDLLDKINVGDTIKDLRLFLTIATLTVDGTVMHKTPMDMDEVKGSYILGIKSDFIVDIKELEDDLKKML